MQFAQGQEDMSRGDGTGLLAKLARRKAWCLLGFSLTAAAVGLAFSVMPVTYRASASLMVASDEAVLRSGSSSAEAQRLGDPADIESQMLMLRSPRLARIILGDSAVVAALVADCEATREGSWLTRTVALLQKPPACKPTGPNDFAMLRRLETGFSIGPTGRSRVIEVSFVSPVPETAVIVANALVDAYLRDDRERKVDTHDNAINWLNAEIMRSGQELRHAELGVEAYRAEHGIVRGQQASITSERLSGLGQQLAVAQAAFAFATSRLNQAGGADAQEVLSNRVVSDLKQQSALLGARAAELRQRYGDSHPQVAAAAGQRREVEARLEQETRRVGASLQRDVAAATARVSELRQQYETLMREVGNTGGAEAGIAIMVRDVEARREIYVEQLKKVNILQTERRLLSGDARLVNHAEVPDRPWFPKKLPFITVGMVMASAVGAGIGLLREHADRTLRAETFRPVLGGAAIAGYLPWVRSRRGGRLPVLHMHEISPLQESVRALFSRLILVPGQAPRSIIVSSSDMGEGKSFLTLALALFAVTTRRRVLVIEADLRRPTFATSLGLAKSPGLSEFLRGEVKQADVVSRYHGLEVITAGVPCTDSTELLSGQAFAGLLHRARREYDLVLVDSPPTLLLMDAQVMARHADGIIYCASLGRSHLDRVERGVRELRAAGGKILGVVVGARSGGDRQHAYSPVGGSYLPGKP